MSHLPHVAIIRHRANDEITRAVIVPPDQDFRNCEDRAWLHPYLGEDFTLHDFVPVALIPYEERRSGGWPEGEPDQARIEAEIARSLERLVVITTRGDLARLDRIITFAESMAELWSEDFADDLFNLRNHMVPFRPGDEHYDPDGDEE